MSRGRRIGLRLTQLALTVLMTWVLFRVVGVQLDDLRGLDPAEWKPDFPLLGLASGLLVGGYAMSAWVWSRMVQDLGGPKLPPGTSVRIFMVANMGRYVPGKIWQIAGLAALAAQKGVKAPVAMGAAVVGQGVAILAAAFVGTSAFMNGDEAMRTWGWVFLGGTVVGVGLLSYPPVIDRLMGLWSKGATEESPSRPPPGMVLRWLALYMVNWVVYAAAFWLFVLSFGREGSVFQLAPAYAAAYVVGYLSIVAPAGVGVREATLAVFLAPVVGQGSAVALALLARLWTTGVEVIPAAGLWMRHVQLSAAAGGEAR